MKCLRCGYERGPRDEAPAWQCPSCKVAYVKASAAAAPVAPPEPASKREPVQEDREDIESGIQEWQVARGQKVLIHCIILNFVLRAVDRAQLFPDLVMLGFYMLTAAWSLLGVVRICSGLQRSQGQKILFMVLTFFPLINLIVLVYLSVKATRLLRDAGWSVGLLGARQ